jgi:hypothetical protein
MTMFSKKMPLLLAALLGLAISTFAQVSPVREMDKTMSFGTRPCFRLEFAGADDGKVADLWEDFVKERFGAKLKKDKKSGERYATEVSASSLSSSPVTIRSSVEKSGKDAALNVWFDLGAGFLNRREQPQAANAAVSLLSDFYVVVRKEVIGEELRVGEKKLKDLEGDKRKLEKQNDGLHKDIEDYKAKIKKAEEEIVRNEQAQNTNVADQDAQRRVIESIRLRLQNVDSERGGN